MTSLLSQIEAAAAMQAKATDQGRWTAYLGNTTTDMSPNPPVEAVTANGNHIRVCGQIRATDSLFVEAAANLPLSEIAEELRTARAAREAAEVLVTAYKHAAAMASDRAAILAAECESLRAVVERQAEDIEAMQECLEQLKQPTIGPATLSNLGAAGEHEVRLRMALAERVQESCNCWKDAEKQAAQEDAAEAARLAGKESQ